MAGIERLQAAAQKLLAYGRARLWGRHARLGSGVRFGPGVRCSVGQGGLLVIGDGAEIGAGTSLVVQRHGELRIGDRVFISGACTLAAAGRVEIGSESMLGEMVSVRDHDHDPAFPPRSGRMKQADVLIGERVWIAAKASVVRGATIGDDAVIGAHSLVNREVPAAALAAGVPAVIRRRNIRRPG